MTTSIIRFKKEWVEMSSDKLIVWGYSGIRYSNKIIKLSESVWFIYAGIHISEFWHTSIEWKSPIDVQNFIQAYDTNMQIIIRFLDTYYYITKDYIDIIKHDCAIWSWAEVAMWLLRYSKEISTKDIYKTISSLDIFTSKEFDSILLPI